MTTTVCICYRHGFKYQLVEDYLHKLPFELCQGEPVDTKFFCYDPAAGTLLIREGYAWDGPSGPSFDTKTFMRGSLVHDAGYQLMREGKMPRSTKPHWDRHMQEICKVDGMFGPRAWWCFKAVEQFGMDATIRNKNILVAP